MADNMPVHYLLAAVVRRLMCGLAGHRWDRKVRDTRTRWCGRCYTAENLADDPPAGHPDAIPVPIGPRGEEFLAWAERTQFTRKAA